MTRLRALASRVAALFVPRRREVELSEEIQAHLDLLTEEHVRRGMPLSEARAAARREFGGVDQMKESYRDQRGVPWLEMGWRDIQYAIRSLRRAPMFAIVVILTFAFGIGATTAVFAIVNALLLRELPYPNAARVVEVRQTIPPGHLRDGRTLLNGLSPDQLYVVRANSRTLQHVAFWGTDAATLTGAGDPMRINGARVSAGFFEAFGVRPVKGRTFTREDEPPGAARVVMLSYTMWTRRFGQDPDIVGKTIVLDGQPARTVGVMGPGFALPELPGALVARLESGAFDAAPEFWVPIRLSPPTGQPAAGFTLRQALAAIAPGYTREQAVADTTSILAPLPDGVRPTAADLVGLRDEMTRPIRRVLILFQVAVVFVLLIACANVANLCLARASHRRRELAIRLALGASRFRAASESITECVLLAVAGSVLGGAIAFGVVAVVKALPPGLVPRTGEIRVDGVAIAFALGLSLTAGAIVGTFVAIRVLWTERLGGLHQSTASTMTTRSRPSAALVVVQVAAAVVLLTGGGLLLASFVKLISVAPGLATANLLTFRVDLPRMRYPDNERQRVFYRQTIDALSRVAGVEAVTVTTALPFQPTAISSPVVVDGERADGRVAVSHTQVAPGYFRALGAPVLAGREFSPDDRAGAPRVVLVSQSFASRFFGGRSPIGRAVRLLDGPPTRIVGVVADPKRDLRTPGGRPSFPELFYPLEQPPNEQFPWTSVARFAMRTTGDPLILVGAMRRAVAAIDPTLAIANMATVEQMLSDNSAATRAYGVGAATFAGAAFFLAIVGLYGVMASSVGSRTQEFGVRMALGADGGRVVRLVVRQGMRLVAAGLALGIAGAWFTTRALQGLLFGVTPNDPRTRVSVTALFLTVASIACYVPARRASRVDPMVALRHE